MIPFSGAPSKRLDPSQVKRSDKGRELAERQAGKKGPGRPRKDGTPAQPRPKTVEDATKLVKSESKPVEKTATAAPASTEWREPTKGEIAQVRFLMEMGNKPLVQLERDMSAVGIVSDRPDALVRPGEIPATEDELENGSLCTAGALVAIAPNYLPYLSIFAFGMFTVSFVGTRLLIFWRIKRHFDGLEKQEKENEERRAAQRAAASKLSPAGNGAQPRGELTPIPVGAPSSS